MACWRRRQASSGCARSAARRPVTAAATPRRPATKCGFRTRRTTPSIRRSRDRIRAQGTTMAAYLIAHIEITEPAGYEEYRKRVPPIVTAHGGRFLARGGAIEVLEGTWSPK